MKCEAQKAIESMDNDLTDAEILKLEVSYRRCSMVCAGFNKALNQRIIERQREKDSREKPSSQEEDRKSQGTLKANRWKRIFSLF